MRLSDRRIDFDCRAITVNSLTRSAKVYECSRKMGMGECKTRLQPRCLAKFGFCSTKIIEASQASTHAKMRLSDRRIDFDCCAITVSSLIHSAKVCECSRKIGVGECKTRLQSCCLAEFGFCSTQLTLVSECKT